MGDTNQSSSGEKKAPLAPFVPNVLGGLTPPKNVVKPLPNPGQVGFMFSSKKIENVDAFRRFRRLSLKCRI